MPLFEFWHSSTDSISWHYQDDPKLGDEIVLGDGVFRVIAGRPLSDCAAYDVEFVRRATFEESQAAGIGLDDLRLSGDW